MQARRCEICDLQSQTLFKCRLCGRTVCPSHFHPEKGICAACSETLCEICGEKLAIGYCAVCGKLVCEDCSVEVGPALLCKRCARERTDTKTPSFSAQL